MLSEIIPNSLRACLISDLLTGYVALQYAYISGNVRGPSDSSRFKVSFAKSTLFGG